MTDKIMKQLAEFKGEAAEIQKRYEQECKDFFARLEKVVYTDEFLEYGREHSMSYQHTNPLWEIDDILAPHMFGIYGWMPSSWERC